MDDQLAAIVVAVITVVGGVAVAYVTRSKPADTAGTPPPTVESQTGRGARALDAVVDELVDAHNEIRDLRREVWGCSVEHCPVRDHLRKEDR